MCFGTQERLWLMSRVCSACATSSLSAALQIWFRNGSCLLMKSCWSLVCFPSALTFPFFYIDLLKRNSHSLNSLSLNFCHFYHRFRCLSASLQNSQWSQGFCQDKFNIKALKLKINQSVMSRLSFVSVYLKNIPCSLEYIICECSAASSPKNQMRKKKRVEII